LFQEGVVVENQTILLTVLFGRLTLFKLLFVYFLRRYRVRGKNYRNVVIIGGNQSLESISTLFHERSYLGYKLLGHFSDKHIGGVEYLGSITDAVDFILNNEVDEIYCSISEFTEEELKKMIEFGNTHQKVVKLIPDSRGVFSKGMVLEYYDYIPVLSMKKLPFDNPVIKYSKRIFDILFSTFIIVFVLSWISVILFILVKLESKGPLIFKQHRDGLNGKHFECYKFRSMGMNKDAHEIQATKGDMRVTKVGKFIRKTSVDELPQFINVLIGDMSVVGPRPHMTSQSKKYAQVVDKYFMRNLVKPGVTGLAQVRGLRGEIETNSDMNNRVRMDIFYINNWSFVLDIKIIFQTMFNAVKGEDKAY
jgi:putative colanic acid biosynthesis UDP-glucose lipid carrier transferase